VEPWFLFGRNRTTHREWVSATTFAREDAEDLLRTFTRDLGDEYDFWIEPNRRYQEKPLSLSAYRRLREARRDCHSNRGMPF